MKRLITGIVLAAGLLGLSAYAFALPAAAARRYRTETENHVRVGDVNIRLTQYDLNEKGKRISCREPKTVIPGETVRRTAEVTNLGADAWIRIHAGFENKDGIRGVDVSMLELASEKWIKKGEYYYWPGAVPHGETIPFLKAVRIPAGWDSGESGRTFRIVIRADAVQERNFTPDFEAEEPWFGTVIEQCVHDEYSADSEGSDIRFKVEFRGGAEGLVKTGDDFFSCWPELLPGDTGTGSVFIRNRYAQAVRIWFHSETAADPETDLLIGKLHLTIRNGAEMIYDGPLSGVTENVSLGDYRTGDESELIYTLKVPEELNNLYARTDTLTKWVFECELLEPEGPDQPEKDKDKPDPPRTPDKPVQPVKTGDENAPALYAALCAAAALSIAAALYISRIRKRRRDSYEE